MPWAAKRPCPRCGVLVENGLCATCREKRTRQVDARRGSSAARGYGAAWQRYRLQYLRQHPLCRSCEARSRVSAANVVDHIQPHKGDPRLFWDPTNHQPLCTPCHNHKTGTQDGGFGRARAQRAGPGSGAVS